MEINIGEEVLVNPQVTKRKEWIKATIVEIEKNPFVGLVITVETKLGELFFEKADMFKKINEELCTQ